MINENEYEDLKKEKGYENNETAENVYVSLKPVVMEAIRTHIQTAVSISDEFKFGYILKNHRNIHLYSSKDNILWDLGTSNCYSGLCSFCWNLKWTHKNLSSGATECENLPRTNSTKCETQNIFVKSQQNEHTPALCDRNSVEFNSSLWTDKL